MSSVYWNKTSGNHELPVYQYCTFLRNTEGARYQPCVSTGIGNAWGTCSVKISQRFLTNWNDCSLTPAKPLFSAGLSGWDCLSDSFCSTAGLFCWLEWQQIKSSLPSSRETTSNSVLVVVGNEPSWYRLPILGGWCCVFPAPWNVLCQSWEMEETKGPFGMPRDWSHLCSTTWKASGIGLNPSVVSREWSPSPTTCQILPCALHSCCSQGWTVFRKWELCNVLSEGTGWLHETAGVDRGTLEKQLFN